MSQPGEEGHEGHSVQFSQYFFNKFTSQHELQHPALRCISPTVHNVTLNVVNVR